MNPNTTVSWETVSKQEKEIVRHQRAVRRDQSVDECNSDNLTGIAISGGGIRSASFALGVLQGLHSGSQLEKFDYLSTVSGGGYIGSSWSWFNYLRRKGEITSPNGEYFFPFGTKHEGARSEESCIQNQILSYIRQHGSYFVPGLGLGYLSLFAVVFRNLLLPMLVYLSVLIVLFIGFDKLEYLLETPLAAFYQFFQQLHLPLVNSLSSLITGLSVVGLIGMSLLYGPITFFYSHTSTTGYKIRTYFQFSMGILVTIAVLSGLISLLPYVILELEHAIASGGAGLVGVFGGIWRFVRDRQGKANKAISQYGGIISSLLIIFALLALAYYIAAHPPELGQLGLPEVISNLTLFTALLLAVIVLVGGVVNLNQYSLGRMYRDRLIETFMPNPETIKEGRWHLATQAGITPMHEVCTKEDQGPYHLVNCNVILIDSSKKKFRSRGGDNFILSSLYCGGDALGWTKTNGFNNGDLTLATAMATSGAAVNPHAGSDSGGITRNPFISFLLFFLGFRLGLYVVNPVKKLFGWASRPNYLRPGIYQGLLGLGFNRTSSFLELTDGGDFDNTAGYELIRRRLDLIVMSEAGQDQDFSFGDIANFVEKVRVDFGVHIRFFDEFSLQYVVPGSIFDKSAFTDRYDMAERGFAIAQIRYPAAGDDREKCGLLFFVKATMITEVPADIYGYKDGHPEFPNQSTADQFFDEKQLEAYRELGYQITSRLLDNNVFVEALKNIEAAKS